MKTYIKYLISMILTIVPLVAIVYVAVHFSSDKYLLKNYYELALDGYKGFFDVDEESDSLFDDDIQVFVINEKMYNRIANYDKMLGKFKGPALEDFKYNSNVIEYDGSYYIAEDAGASLEGYSGKYDYEVIDDSFSKKTYKIISYFCDLTSDDVECAPEEGIGVYKVETQFSIERNFLNWQIVEFTLPKADPKYNFDESDDDIDELEVDGELIIEDDLEVEE